MKISTDNFCRMYEQSVINLSKFDFEDANKTCMMLVKLNKKYAECKYYLNSTVRIDRLSYAKLMILASY